MRQSPQHTRAPRREAQHIRAPEREPSKQRLLDAAERCFAERGFEGASLRELTRAAGLSVSAANYHFGSKEELLAAVVRRRVRPLNARRLARLDALEAQPEPPTLEALLDAYLRPIFEGHEAARREGRETLPREFAARLHCEPPERVQALRAEIFGEVQARFHAAFARALPDASESALGLLQQLAIAAMVHVLSGQLDPALMADFAAQAAPQDAPHEPLLRALVTHVAAGGRALAALPSTQTNARDTAKPDATGHGETANARVVSESARETTPRVAPSAPANAREPARRASPNARSAAERAR